MYSSTATNRTKRNTRELNLQPPLHCILSLLGLARGDRVVHARAGAGPGRHAAARHALEHALKLGRAVREAVAPEAVAGVLDELDEGDEQPPLFSYGSSSGRAAAGRETESGRGLLYQYMAEIEVKPNSTQSQSSLAQSHLAPLGTTEQGRDARSRCRSRSTTFRRCTPHVLQGIESDEIQLKPKKLPTNARQNIRQDTNKLISTSWLGKCHDQTKGNQFQHD